MAKSNSSKLPASDAKTNASFSTNENMNPEPASDNNSKYEPTDEAAFDTVTLDPEDGLNKLLEDCIKYIYWAENHLVISLPKMAQAASNADLQQAILNHLRETKTHVERLEQAFNILGKTPQAKKCDAMEGLTKEGEAVIETTDMGTPARNLGIIMASQKVEHYEIASYRGIIKLSDSLGYAELSSLLSETLAEEEKAEDLLATISDEVVNADGESNN